MVKEAATDANIGKNSKDDSNCLFSFSKSLELSVGMSIFRIKNEDNCVRMLDWMCVVSVSCVQGPGNPMSTNHPYPGTSNKSVMHFVRLFCWQTTR